MKIIITSDLHLGKSFNFKKKDGISSRSLDFIKQFKIIVEYAIKVGAELIIIAGDFYDKPVVNATIKKILRKEVIVPAMKKKINFLLIGGNHDSHPHLTRGCDMEDLGLSPRFTTIRTMNKVLKFKSKNSGETLGLLLLPYLHNQAILDYEMKPKIEGMEEVKEISNELAVDYLSTCIDDGLKKLEGVDKKILIGHYYVMGTKLSNKLSGIQLNEIQFNPSLLHSKEFDLVVMGHIHKPQEIDNIIVPGSIERVTFGEREETKSFIELNTENMKWKRVNLDCRKMIQIEIDLLEFEGSNPTTEIVEEIKKHDISDAMVKVVISTKQSMRNKIDDNRIERSLDKSFHPIISYKIFDEERPMIDMSRVNMLDHDFLLEGFVKMRFPNEDLRRDVELKAKEILELCKDA